MRKIISIIIATKDADRYIDRCLKSIFHQKTESIELIIIDSESVDETHKVITKFSEITDVYVSEPDNGIYDAWNKGIRHSTGEWVLFLGSDDILLDGSLNYYISDVLLRYGICDYHFIAPLNHMVTDTGELVATFGAKFDWIKFRKNMNLAHVGSLTNRKLFAEVGEFDTNYKICGDYELLLRKKDALKVYFINKVIANMQIGGISQANINAIYEARSAKKRHNVDYSMIDELLFLLTLLKFKLVKQ